MPRGKCTAKRRRIIWGKRGTNNIENRRRIQRGRRRSNGSKERPKCNGYR